MITNAVMMASVSSGVLPERPRLLVVDDQPVNIQALYQIFHDDHDVFMATSGPQALEICKKKLPDLILLDVVMPVMGGIEVCRRLKQDAETQDIPVIFVTAHDSPEDEMRGLEVGAADFISKPVNPGVVRARVKTHLTLKAQSDLLRALVFKDGLTGIANRRHFDEQLETAWRAGRRDGSALALAMIDVDHFKLYNDRYGHQQGDICLRSVAQALHKCATRARDLVARYGGEEFSALLPDTTIDGARVLGESFRAAVADLQLPHEASSTANVVTISVGIAVVVPHESTSVRDLVLAADQQLYRAKKAGRNRVEVASLTDD